MMAIERAKNVAPAAKVVNCLRDRGEKSEESIPVSVGAAGGPEFADMLEMLEWSINAMCRCACTERKPGYVQGFQPDRDC